MELSMKPKMWMRSGPEYGYGTGRAFFFEVRNLPPGEEALICNFGGRNQDRWRVLQIKEGVSGHWAGNYASAPEALATLSQ
jgi:hypothetical protein